MTRLTDYTVEAYIAVKATRRTAANNWWLANIDPEGGDKTFNANLSSDGSSPGTWCLCHTALRLNQLAKVYQAIQPLPQSDVRAVFKHSAHGRKADIIADIIEDAPKIIVLDDNQDYTLDQMLSRTGMQVVASDV